MKEYSISNKEVSYHPNELQKARLGHRFLAYCKERFPLIKHASLVAAFTASPIAFSMLSRGMSAGFPWLRYGIATISVYLLFLLMRIIDEHKDAEDDALYRSELPVPRGLISLKELRQIGIPIAMIIICIHLIFVPSLIPFLVAIVVYLYLMTKEFFISDTLRQKPIAYALSHMAIMPIIDLYVTAYDWYYLGYRPSSILISFIALSFINGLIIEIGRKIKAPQDEKHGVISYSKKLGIEKSTLLWMVLIVICCLIAMATLASILPNYYLLTGIFLVMLVTIYQGLQFLNNPSTTNAQGIENASGIWMLVLYLSIGVLPFIIK